ncbi:MAG: hypothetical protein ACR2P7_03310 [bacterium]
MLSALGAEAVLAHGGERGLVMLLPTGHYKAAAASAVAASFALLLWAPAARLRDLAACSLPLFRARAPRPRIAPRHWPSWLSFALLCALLAAARLGSPDPLANPLPLFVWTLWWCGFTLLQCALGDLWARLNPWSGPLAILRRALRLRAPTQPPRWLQSLGYAPALLLFFVFAWFELVDPAPDNPARLGNAVLLYWCFTALACLRFGEAHWLRYAEPLTIFFRLVAGCSPLLRRRDDDHAQSPRALRLCLPGARFIRMPPLPMSGVLFVLLTLSSVSFDGLRKTFAYLGAIGVNPLAFPGRSAVVGANTVGLLLAFVALAATFLLCVWLGCQLARRADWFARACGRLVYSIIPISLVFHFAHYLSALLLNAQYALLAFNDPFAAGWNLLAARDYVVTASFLAHLPSVSLIWMTQTLAIVLGHVIGIGVAHLIALELLGDAKSAAVSQAFLAALMVGYTVFGLWLLSTPAIG